MIKKVTDDVPVFEVGGDESNGDELAKSQQEFFPCVMPFTVIVDTREQAPYHFQSVQPEAYDRKKGRTAVVVPVENKALSAGDYSISGFQDRIAIERKSRNDFLNCLTNDRRRFEEQLSRLQQLEFAAVVVEASLSHLLEAGTSNVNPKVIHRSVIAFQTDHFPKVHWWFCHDRYLAEMTTLRLLERWWKANQQK